MKPFQMSIERLFVPQQLTPTPGLCLFNTQSNELFAN